MVKVRLELSSEKDASKPYASCQPPHPQKKMWNSHLTNNRRDNSLPQKSGHPPAFPLFSLRAHNNKNSVIEWSLNWFSLRAPLHRKTISGGFEYTMAELKIAHRYIIWLFIRIYLQAQNWFKHKSRMVMFWMALFSVILISRITTDAFGLTTDRFFTLRPY